MFSRSDEKRKIGIISNVLSNQGFEVIKNYKIGNKFFADVVGIRNDKVILFEVKTGSFRSDQSDLMQVSGFVGALREKEEFQDRHVSGCIISPGTIPVAAPLVHDLGIDIIKGNTEDEIREGIMRCISRDREE